VIGYGIETTQGPTLASRGGHTCPCAAAKPPWRRRRPLTRLSSFC